MNDVLKKILILPYHLDNKIKDLDYLSEGILEELISMISYNPKVKTTSRTTSLYLKNNPLPLNEIKERYNLDVVVEGNIEEKEGSYFIMKKKGCLPGQRKNRLNRQASQNI